MASNTTLATGTMPATLTSSAIIFLLFFTYSSDWLFSAAISLGPLAVLFLYSKTEIQEDELQLKASKWLERVFIQTTVGFMYTGCVLLIAGIISIVLPLSFEAYFITLIVVLHFIPHIFKYRFGVLKFK